MENVNAHLQRRKDKDIPNLPQEHGDSKLREDCKKPHKLKDPDTTQDPDINGDPDLKKGSRSFDKIFVASKIFVARRLMRMAKLLVAWATKTYEVKDNTLTLDFVMSCTIDDNSDKFLEEWEDISNLVNTVERELKKYDVKRKPDTLTEKSYVPTDNGLLIKFDVSNAKPGFLSVLEDSKMVDKTKLSDKKHEEELNGQQ